LDLRLFELFDLTSLLPLSPLPLEKIAQLAYTWGIIFLGELVANSPKITPPVWLLFELFRLKKGELKK
jgi:hypothetical protein